MIKLWRFRMRNDRHKAYFNHTLRTLRRREKKRERRTFWKEYDGG